MKKPKAIVVDKNDKVIGYKDRDKITDNDIIRASILWIENSKGEVLLAQRAFSKKDEPGRWGPAVGGTNEKGETYESNIIKEAEEEIGLIDLKPKKFKKVFYDGAYITCFTAKVDKKINEFIRQVEEVEDIKWWTKEQIKINLKKNPEKFTSNSKLLKEWFLKDNIVTKPRIIIVNEKDEIIGHKNRDDLADTDIHWVSWLWIENSKGEVLLAQRSLKKKNNPGLWGPAVAGTNDEGETYEQNIIKEAEEEIGLKNFKLKEFKKILHLNENKKKTFHQIFTAIVDKKISEFKIQEEEVEKIEWWAKDRIRKEYKNHPETFVISAQYWSEWFLK